MMTIRLRHLGVAWAVVLCLVATAAAQERFTEHHVAKLRMVTSVAISPDGTQAAFVLSVPRNPFQEEDGADWAELHVTDADGHQRPFVTGRVNVGTVRWSPDGTRIGFLARRGDDRARSLYVIPADGGEARRVLAHETDITEFQWSHDGTRVAFLAREARPREERELADKGFNQEVFEESVRNVRVWTARIDADAPEPRVLDLPGSASLLAWSPDNTRLLLALAPTGLVDDDLVGRRLHIVDAESGQVLVSYDHESKLDDAAWSPDGQFVGMTAGVDRHDPFPGRLMVVPATGGTPTDIVPGYEADVRTFAWKDAETLVFVGNEGTETTLNEVRRDGTSRRTILPAGGRIFTALSLAPTGVAAFVAHSPEHPAEVYLLGANETAPRRLTDSNPWLAEIRLATQEAVQFKARDGLDLEGILIRPLDETEGQRYPLIMRVHGGPEAHDPNGWLTSYTSPGQVGAAQGFAVFYPNYRGSTGRGVEFSKLGQGDPAGAEFDDLIDAVDHLVEMGLADHDRVGITGGSYGGYASAWGATYHTDRFAAAVMFVGISNKISKVGTSDIPDELYLVHLRKRPWEDWQSFLERSPIYHAEKSRTPILIMHGTADTRVHPGQSLELYRYLKLHGNTPVRLVWYPGEGHGNRRAAARLDYNLRLMQWMNHYLQGPGGEPPPFRLDYQAPEVGFTEEQVTQR